MSTRKRFGERQLFIVHGREYHWTFAELTEQMGLKAMPDEALDIWVAGEYPLPLGETHE